MRTKYIFCGVIWSLGSGWADGSEIIAKHKVSIILNKANHARAKDLAHKVWNQRGYQQPECIELQSTINIK